MAVAADRTGLRAWLLLDIDLDLLFGNPAMHMLKQGQSCLAIAITSRVTQLPRSLTLTVCTPFRLRHCRQRVHLAQPTILHRQHAGSQGQIITLQAKGGSVINRLKALFGRFELACRQRERFEHGATVP